MRINRIPNGSISVQINSKDGGRYRSIWNSAICYLVDTQPPSLAQPLPGSAAGWGGVDEQVCGVRYNVRNWRNESSSFAPLGGQGRAHRGLFLRERNSKNPQSAIKESAIRNSQSIEHIMHDTDRDDLVRQASGDMPYRYPLVL